MTSEKITVETPTTKLSDVRATISLLQDTISVRLQYEWFEIVAPALIRGHEDKLLKIGTTIVDALSLMDEQIANGRLVIQSVAHLRLDSGDPDRYVSEHLSGGNDLYEADAFAFNVRSPKGESRRCRIVIARSALFDGSVFVDYVAEYPEPRFVPELVQEIRSEYNDRLALLGLSEAHP